MKTTPEQDVNLVDLGFMDARHKVLDIAAFLDRIERSEQADDYRVRALQEAIQLLNNPGTDRVKTILDRLSDQTEKPIPEAHGKGASGAWKEGDARS